MTRINVIPPQELCDKHLGAEYRELPRVFRLARPGKVLPPQYTLGKGHVLFFYDKLLWLADRGVLIAEECRRRGRAVNFDPAGLYGLCPHPELYGSWAPTEEAFMLNRARIAERLAKKPPPSE